eukprot:3780443-Prorocentrum_lima.AAC.1
MCIRDSCTTQEVCPWRPPAPVYGGGKCRAHPSHVFEEFEQVLIVVFTTQGLLLPSPLLELGP